MKVYGELPESTKINESDLYDEEGDGGIEFQDGSGDEAQHIIQDISIDDVRKLLYVVVNLKLEDLPPL